MAETKVRLRHETVDVSRVTKVTPNEMTGDAAPTYTLTFDGFHDDTNARGDRTLEEGKVGDYEKDMPKSGEAHIGNRATYTEKELVASGFFKMYNTLNPGANVGPSSRRKADDRDSGDGAGTGSVSGS